MKTKTNNNGFTLIEVIILFSLIAIISISLVIGLNPVDRMQDARNNQRQFQVVAIHGALTEYVSREKDVPTCLALPDNSIDLINCTELVPDYLSEIPEDPSIGSSFCDYSTGYFVKINSSGAIGVRAECTEKNEDKIIFGVW